MMDDYVDQSSMVDDFLSQELVFQESGEEFTAAPDKSNAETAETEIPENVEQAAKPEAESTETPGKEGPAAGVDAEDPFSFVEKLPDGTERFNPISAMDFIARKTSDGKEAPAFKVEPPEVQAPAAQPQNAEPAVSYEDSLKSLYFAGFDYLESFINQGYDFAQASRLAKQAADADLRNHIYEKNMKDMENRLRSEFEEKKSAAQKAADIESLRPESTKNLHEMAKHGGYGSIDNLYKALTTPSLGGDVIQYFFKKDSAGQVFKSVEERAAAMNDWFIKFSADKEALGMLEEVTRARISNKNLPKLIAEARKTKEKVESTNAKGKGFAPVSAQNKSRPNPANTQNTGNVLADFLGVPIDEV